VHEGHYAVRHHDTKYYSPFSVLNAPSPCRYVFVRPIMAIISLLAFAIPPHVYKEGEFEWTGPHSMFAWSMVIINVSQVLAL
jgi:hypothetical protein